MLASIYFSPVSPNRRAVRAKAVSPVALTYFHRFRSRLDGPVPRQVLQPAGPAGYLDQVAVVAHPVRDRARRHVYLKPSDCHPMTQMSIVPIEL